MTLTFSQQKGDGYPPVHERVRVYDTRTRRLAIVTQVHDDVLTVRAAGSDDTWTTPRSSVVPPTVGEHCRITELESRRAS